MMPRTGRLHHDELLEHSASAELHDLHLRGAIEALNRSWDENQAPPDPARLEQIWLNSAASDSPRLLLELIKHDQYRRLQAGQPAELDLYLSHFPNLLDDKSRQVSLAYSEFCSRRQLGQDIFPDEFCEKYHDLSHSLHMQLAIHQMLSLPSNELQNHEIARHFPVPGQVVEHFELIRELGRGGTARVFLARDLSLGRRPVALKISGDRSTEPEILAKLDHDNIVPVLSVHDTTNGLRLICMPFRGSVTLDRLFSRCFPETARAENKTAGDFRKCFESLDKNNQELQAGIEGPDEGWKEFPAHSRFTDAVAWVGWKLALALAHAHSLKIYHRDIKPANILISRKSGPQLLDFNMARDPEALEQIEDRIRGGTLPYMAPEQLGAFLDSTLWADIREQADIYSLGLVLQEWLRGKRVEIPLPASSPVIEQVRALLRRRGQPWSSICQSNRQVSWALDAVLARALEFRMADRYPNAQAFADDLKAIIDRRPLLSTHNPSLRERLFTSARSLRKWAAVPLIVLPILYFTQRPAPTSAIAIPGVSSKVVASVRQRQIQEAFQHLQQQPASLSNTTAAEIMRLIIWSEARPADPTSFQLITPLMLAPDLDFATNQVLAAIGPHRQLDFLPLFRDFCRLNDFEKKGEKVASLDWLSMERRFFDLSRKWPEDFRIQYYLATLAAKRADFEAAGLHINQAIELLNKTPAAANRVVRDDFLKNRITWLFNQAAATQKANQPDQALMLYTECYNAIETCPDRDTMNENTKQAMNELQISSALGQGDCFTDKFNYPTALKQYRLALDLINLHESELLKTGSLERLRTGIEIRMNQVQKSMQQSP